MRFSKPGLYPVFVEFRKRLWPEEWSDVLMVGVRVENMGSVAFSGGKTKVKPLMDRSVKISVDTGVVIKSRGVMGGGYVELIPAGHFGAGTEAWSNRKKKQGIG